MSIWDDIADSREEAENLKVRAALMRAIGTRISDADWSQAEAAERLGLTQPRVSDLIRGKISKFSLDALVDAAAKLGIHVRVEVLEHLPHLAVECGGNPVQVCTALTIREPTRSHDAARPPVRCC